MYKFDLHPYGFDRTLCFSSGNSKVHCPVFSVGSGLSCTHRKTCPYSLYNPKRTGPLCYAQKIERLRENVLAARNENERALKSLYDSTRLFLGCTIIRAFADRIADVCLKMKRPYVRLNESGDLTTTNTRLLVWLVDRLNERGIKTWTYSKSSPELCEQLINVGCVVMRSDWDFVVVNNEEEAQALGLPLCPGGCGETCFRCIKGLRTAVIKH